MTCGVPQGSILGLTLFSLYVNDLPKFTEPSVRLFANDTIMIVSDNTLDKLNNTANNKAKIIDKWLTSNKLILNTFKTSFMLFSPKKMSADKFSCTIQGERINRTSVAKYLGLQVLQNKIIRIICYVSKNKHVKNNTLYHELKLLKVKDMYHLEMAKFMYLFQHNKLPNLFNQYFT